MGHLHDLIGGMGLIGCLPCSLDELLGPGQSKLVLPKLIVDQCEVFVDQDEGDAEDCLVLAND